MLSRIKLRNSIFRLIPALADIKERLSLLKLYPGWRSEGLSVPAPHPIKRALLMREANRINAETFVETGTFTGDTVWFMRSSFRKIISIEVQKDLAAIAAKRFRAHKHIKIVEGDSAEVLANSLPEMVGPVLFWLDGHYSAGITGKGKKDCPIYEELASIASQPPATFSIVIDDFRCFGTEPGYPTFDELSKYITGLFPRFNIETELDMIWCREASR